MKKRIMCAVLCVVMTTVLATGCSSGNDTKNVTSDGSAQPEASNVAAVDQRKVYVSPEWVKSVIDGGQTESSNYVILECGWGAESDDAAYGKGHIQGAIHMNTDNIEEDQYWNVRTPQEIEDLCAKFGITKDTTVICYADSPTNSADDRVAFVMLWAGVENVKCLDGGLEAWTNAGYDLQTDSNAPVATDAGFGTTIPAHPEYIRSIDEVQNKIANDSNFKLVSIRSKDEFLGKTSGYSYIDRAGEPEGAIWGHDTDDGSYTNADGTAVDTDVLNGYLQESGASLDNELCFYCGTGWRATVPFLICYQSGMDNMSVYDGGWFQWQMNSDLPVQVGDPSSSNCVHTTVGELPTGMAKK